MNSEEQTVLILAVFGLTIGLIIGAAIGYEFFKVTHTVICPETLSRCVQTPWS